MNEAYTEQINPVEIAQNRKWKINEEITVQVDEDANRDTNSDEAVPTDPVNKTYTDTILVHSVITRKQVHVVARNR